MNKVLIYTDGSARGNPEGPGGYGTILRYTDPEGTVHEREYSGGFARTSNNRMELLAAIIGLEALSRPCEVELYSDSKYLIDAHNRHWIDNWQQNGWHTAGKEPIRNRDLWERLLSAEKNHSIEWHWVRGHSGHPENERCDRLATSAADAAGREEAEKSEQEEVKTKQKEASKTRRDEAGSTEGESTGRPGPDGSGTKEDGKAMKIKVKRVSPTAALPTRGSSAAAGYDLRADVAEDTLIAPGETRLIDTGLQFELPEGYFAGIFARSGLASREGLRPANCVGVCDSDYRGNYMVPLHNDSSETRIIAPQEKIAQMIVLPFLPLSFEEVPELGDSGRGAGGFGSTGKQ